MKDNCICCNCETHVLVEVGADVCPVCGAYGCLSWVEGEPQEVDPTVYNYAGCKEREDRKCIQ